MRHDDIERLLADEETITPSAGFLGAVMDAVEREAAAPPPLEFPWSRALPGLLVAIAALAASTWQGIGAVEDPAFEEQLRQLWAIITGMGLQWVGLAVAITIVSVLLPLSLLRAPRHALP